MYHVIISRNHRDLQQLITLQHYCTMSLASDKRRTGVYAIKSKNRRVNSSSKFDIFGKVASLTLFVLILTC